MTAEFKREMSRTFVVAPDFPPIVAICVEDRLPETLRSFYKLERDKGKIVIVLSEDFPEELNANYIALADELFVINPNRKYDDFTASMANAAQKLGKAIRVLRD